MRSYSLDNLNDNNFLRTLIESVNDIEFYNDTKEALDILLGLKKAIKTNQDKLNPELADQYREIKVRLKFILFLSISDDEVLDLLKHHLVVGIQMAYVDLLALLKTRISFLHLEDRDVYKEKIKNILLSNRELLTQKKIPVNNKDVSPDIAHWLSVYNATVGGGPVNNLAQSNFYIRNHSFIQLTDAEKMDVKEMFNIYEYLKRSSKTIDGNEDNMFIEDIDGSVILLQDGMFVDILKDNKKKKVEGIALQPLPDNKSQELQALAAQYPAGSLERRAVEEEIERLKK